MEISTISEQLLFSTVLVRGFEASNTNFDKPNSRGTAFVFKYQFNGKSSIFLVTNKHVVKGMQKVLLTFTQARDGKPLMGTPYTLPIDNVEQWWYGHPDDDIDVAVAPFSSVLRTVEEEAGVDIFYCSIDSPLIPTEDTLKTLDAFEDIIFIGYPNGLWDHVNLLPIIRRGITATPIAVDFIGKKQFLIDASVFPGSSGSPVFLFNRGSFPDKSDGSLILGDRLIFLGLISSTYPRHEINDVEFRFFPTVIKPVVESHQMIDLGVVFKSQTIVETINSLFKDKSIDID